MVKSQITLSDVQELCFYIFSADNTVMRAALSVSSVDKVDINRKFVCILSSPQLVQGQSRQEITIIKGVYSLKPLQTNPIVSKATCNKVRMVHCVY